MPETEYAGRTIEDDVSEVTAAQSPEHPRAALKAGPRLSFAECGQQAFLP